MPKPAAGRVDMTGAIEHTGYSRKTISEAAIRGDIPGAHQLRRKSPWTFSVAGLCKWAGIDDTEVNVA